MNFLGISFLAPLPKTSHLFLQDAPLRPGLRRLLGACCGLAFPFGLFVLVLNFNPIIASVGWLGMGAALWVFVAQWKKCERCGWYKRREVTTPDLPYQMRALGERIVFGEESVTFSSFLSQTRTISYAEIEDVHTRCKGDCLEGISLSLTCKGYRNAKTCSQSISDSGEGERTRTTLAILRLKAPHAIFTGPCWVEEGWVPRLGFTHPSSPSPGGC